MTALLGVTALLVRPVAATAAEYWSYQYKNIDVTAVGGSAYAVSVARNVDRLGEVLGRVLNFKSGSRLPTHIYILPADVAEQLAPGSGVLYTTSGYDTTVISAVDAGGSDRYWGATFGYVGSILAGDGALRFPYWFTLGVPAVFSTTEFEQTRLKTGGISNYAYTLSRGALIPMRTFLGVRPGDPQLKDSSFSAMYAAQSWYLAREFLVEKLYLTEFSKYLMLLHDGSTESQAFAASFPISYEELDKTLLANERSPTHYFVIPSPRDTSPDATPPQKLSAAEVQARLARANLATSHRAEALRLAGQALQTEPENETALRVLALARFADGNFDGALSSVEQLARHADRSPGALTDSGHVLVSLAAAENAKRAALSVDAATLLKRAQGDYRSALAAGDDLRAWAGLADIYGREKDVQGAREFLETAAHAMERHPRNVNLAYALTNMCARTEQADCALKYAAAWREDSLTESGRAQAAAFESRLRAQQEQRAIVAGGAPAAAAQPPTPDNGAPPQ